MASGGRARASTNPFDNWSSDDEDPSASGLDWFSSLPPTISVPATLQASEERERAASDPNLNSASDKRSQRKCPTKILVPGGSRRCLSQKLSGGVKQENVDDGVLDAGMAAKEKERIQQSLHLLKELVDTEESFIMALDLLDECYKPHVVDGGFLSDSEVACLFNNAEVIAEAHRKVLKCISLRLAEQDIPKDRDKWSCSQVEAIAGSIGLAFNENLAELERLYVEYTSNMGTSRHLLELAKQLDGFSECLEQAKLSASGSNPTLAKTDVCLPALLIRPIQRLCRYTLFFAGILKYVPTRFKCYTSLHRLDCSARSLAALVNKKKAESERMQRAKALKETLIGAIDEKEFLEQEFLFEWTGSMVLVHGRNSIAKRSKAKANPSSTRIVKESACFFLFSDWLIIADPFEGGRYAISASLKLAEVVVETKEGQPMKPGEATGQPEWTLCVLHIFDTIKGQNSTKAKPSPPSRKAGLRLMKEKQKRCTVINEYTFIVGSKATYDAIITAIAAAKHPATNTTEPSTTTTMEHLPAPAQGPLRPVFLQPPQDIAPVENSRHARRRPRRSSMGHAAGPSKPEDGKALCEALDQVFGKASNAPNAEMYTIAS